MNQKYPGHLCSRGSTLGLPLSTMLFCLCIMSNIFPLMASYLNDFTLSAPFAPFLHMDVGGILKVSVNSYWFQPPEN